MQKKRYAWNIHTVLQLSLALLASVMLGTLVGRVVVAVSHTKVYKEAKADVIASITGKPRLDSKRSKRIASEPYHNQRFMNH